MNRSPHPLAPLAALLAALVALAGLTLTGPTAAAGVGHPSDRSSAVGSSAQLAATITYRTITKRERIPFAKRTVRTPRLPRGTRRVVRWGHPGTRVVTYRVKYRDGEPVGTRKVRTRVVRRPESRITRVGTGRRGGGGGTGCSPHYRGACVPIASDVDCAGGSGNGPRYVDGPVHVVDRDVYGLDSDGDGVGCE